MKSLEVVNEGKIVVIGLRNKVKTGARPESESDSETLQRNPEAAHYLDVMAGSVPVQAGRG
jgi:hypothetical protein